MVRKLRNNLKMLASTQYFPLKHQLPHLKSDLSLSSEMATMFLALQCSQCSTMQVKQQKKSSNKWVCAVCNLRQSVCCVYARGPKARDLRKFVQECNMARMEIGRSDSIDLSLPASDVLGEACQPKKRMDWSEFMDPVEETEDGKNKQNELDVEIVTEMSLQKPKYTSSRYQRQTNDIFRKNASKRKRGHEGNNNQDNSCSSGKDGKLRMLSNQQSRWSDYLDDINDEEEIGDETLKGDSYSHSYSLTPGAKEEIATEHLVEDEVHPDFI
ncbi:uncharacterized protein LOC144547377 isoform X2 [Carex rostrata]